MGDADINGLGAEGTDTHKVPSYEKHSNHIPRNHNGMLNKTYSHDQRYTYVNINSTDRNAPNFTREHIGLRNIVTMANIDHDKVVKQPEVAEQKGGLYFSHGYDGYDIDDVVVPQNYENVDLNAIAHILVNNPDFELKMTAHADTSGDVAKNQTLSENRLQTAKILMLDALEQQGLTEEEAQTLYDDRIEPNLTIEALGETDGPVTTDDETKHQGNRVVSFDVIVQQPDHKQLLAAIHKGSDTDNHEHVVVVNMGTSNRIREIDFYPKMNKTSLKSNEHAIADEDVHFAIKIDPDRKLDKAHEFTIDYKVAHNYDADNTSFVIESNTPGAVTNEYNFDTGQIDVSVNGSVAIHIEIPSWIDPAVIKVGQITSGGEVTISPLTNLDDVAVISESKKGQTASSPLYIAADDVKSLSIAAKHLFIEHAGDPEGYQTALKAFGFEEKVSEAFSTLNGLDIETGPAEQWLLLQYSNEDSALYNPDQVMFPDQVYQILYEGEVSTGGLDVTDGHKASVKALLDKVTDAAQNDVSDGPLSSITTPVPHKL